MPASRHVREQMYDTNRSNPTNQPSGSRRSRQASHTTALSGDDGTNVLLAIVGIGCRLPGGVNDWRTFWELLNSGRDAITETPADRWSTEKFYQAIGLFFIDQ